MFLHPEKHGFRAFQKSKKKIKSICKRATHSLLTIYTTAKPLRFYEPRTSWMISLTLSRSTFRFLDNVKSNKL